MESSLEIKDISLKPLSDRLIDRGLQLFTTLRSNMKQKLMHVHDKILLRRMAVIETVNDQKNISQVEHTRHRSVSNFLVNLLAGLTAYFHQEKKPSLNFKENHNALLLVA